MAGDLLPKRHKGPRLPQLLCYEVQHRRTRQHDVTARLPPRLTVGKINAARIHLRRQGSAGNNPRKSVGQLPGRPESLLANDGYIGCQARASFISILVL
jgi:hypothetical protein